MRPDRPRKWSHRKFAINIAVTALGGATLVVLIALIGLLFWMNAEFPLPDPWRDVHPNAEAWLVVRLDRTAPLSRPIPWPVRAALIQDLPTPLTRLFDKGLDDEKCPVQIAVSFPGEGNSAPVLAASLGKYPGLFRLVRREIESRSKKGEFPFVTTDRQGKAVFTAEDTSSRKALALSVVRCSVLWAASRSRVEEMVDRHMAEPPPASPSALPVAFEAGGARFQAWARSWPRGLALSLAGAPAEVCRTFLEQLAKECPEVTRLRELHADGTWTPGTLRLSIGFLAADKPQAAALAASVTEWLHKNGAPWPWRVDSCRARADNERVALDLKLNLTGR